MLVEWHTICRLIGLELVDLVILVFYVLVFLVLMTVIGVCHVGNNVTSK